MSLVLDNNYKKYLDKIKTLYLQTFPEYERRSFSQLKKIILKNNGEVLSILYQGQFAGFLILLKHENTTLIDYFAIKKEFRGRSIGSKAIKKLDIGNPIIIEIEPVDQKSSNNYQRIKRKSFYENLGFKSKNIKVHWYKTTFELMSLNDDNLVNSYFALLDHIFTKEERIKNISLIP